MMSLTPQSGLRDTQQNASGPSRLTPMQEALRDAVARLLPERRRSQRQSWHRRHILARRAPACGVLERVIDEAITTGVPDADVERVALVFLDQVRQKLEVRALAHRPLGVLSLGEAIREEEAIEGDMATIEIECLTAPTPGKLQKLRDLALMLGSSMHRLTRTIDAQLKQAVLP